MHDKSTADSDPVVTYLVCGLGLHYGCLKCILGSEVSLTAAGLIRAVLAVWSTVTLRVHLVDAFPVCTLVGKVCAWYDRNWGGQGGVKASSPGGRQAILMSVWATPLTGSTVLLVRAVTTVILPVTFHLL